MKHRLLSLISVLLLAALALAACGGGTGIETTDAAVEAATAKPTPATTQTSPVPAVESEVESPDEALSTPTAEPQAQPSEAAPEMPDHEPALAETEAHQDALITVTNSPLTVLDSPGGSVLAELPPTTQFGSPTTLSVLDLGEQWVQVGGLPIRPNGSVGYISRADTDLRRVSFRVEVDLQARMLSVYDGDDLYLESPVAIGAPENPTPVGHLFVVTDVLDTGDPNSPYGRFALGLSGMSDQLTEFAGGPGQIGIHGTNDPSSIGNAVSHGCVRVPAEIAEQLAGVLPLGTPVIIV